MGVTRDIDKRKKVEEKLLESYKHLAVINRQVTILLELNKQRGVKNIQKILDFIIDSSIKLSNAKVVALFLNNEEKKGFDLVASKGIPKHAVNIIKENDLAKLSNILRPILTCGDTIAICICISSKKLVIK